MEQTLIYLVVLIVFVLIVLALIRWAGVVIPPIVVQILTYLGIGILCVIVIRFLWPLLTGGSLRLGMIVAALGVG